MANNSGKKGNSTYIGIKQIFNSVVLLGKNEKSICFKARVPQTGTYAHLLKVISIIFSYRGFANT